jgi:2-polyprenyl-3-methyl-5-hydroxy-6-metoxy-1,4-benzoquinol methylase
MAIEVGTPTTTPYWPDLSRRHRQPEIMDRPDLDADSHYGALRSLTRINAWSGGVRMFWPELFALAKQAAPAPLRVLDLATGAGDVPIRLWRKAARAGVALHIEAWDFSPRAVEYARSHSQRYGADVEFSCKDALADEIPADYDAIISSLFLHHLDDEQAVSQLRRMANAARKLVMINDLARGAFGFALAWVGTRLLSRSRVVHVDGPLSVQAAFTPAEALDLAERAGLHGASVRRRWPARYLLTWRRP